MVTSLVLGMGVPSVVCYLLMATLMGSLLSELGVIPLAAHLFIFYFGMMSMVTPPVALAAYASASLAQAPVMPTALAAFRFSLVGFTLPFMFVYRPALLLMDEDGASLFAAGAGGLPPLLLALGAAVVGILALAAGISGYLRAALSPPLRALMLVAAALLLVPDLGGAGRGHRGEWSGRGPVRGAGVPEPGRWRSGPSLAKGVGGLEQGWSSDQDGLLQVGYLDVAPVFVQVLRDQAAVAVVRFVLAAQEAAFRDDLSRDRFLDAAFAHQLAEADLVGLPVAVALLVVVEDVLRGGEFRDVDVLHAADLAEKVGQIVSLGKAGELRHVVEPHIDDPLGAGIAQEAKEAGCRLLREADCGKSHQRLDSCLVGGSVRVWPTCAARSAMASAMASAA